MVSRRILSAVRLPFRHTGESFALFYYTQLEFENQPLFEISQMVYNRREPLGKGGRAMQNSQERALIEAAAGGDPTAFEKLMRMHEARMGRGPKGPVASNLARMI